MAADMAGLSRFIGCILRDNQPHRIP